MTARSSDTAEANGTTGPSASRGDATAFAGVLLACLAFTIGYQPLPRDPDLWFHLAGGRYIVENGCVPQADPFSFTRHGEVWVPHSWLFDLGVYKTWVSWGPRATEGLAAACFAICWLMPFSRLTRKGVPPVTALVVCASLAVAAANARGLRPQLLSLFFTNLCLYLMWSPPARSHVRAVWALPLIFLIWAQVHAACVMGLIVVALWLIGEAIDRHRHGQPIRHLTPRLTGLALSIPAILLTPHVMSHVSYVAMTMRLDGLALTEEWQAPAIWPIQVPDLYFFILTTYVLVLPFCRRRQTPIAPWMIALPLLALAATSVRHLPLACVGCAPLLTYYLTDRTHPKPSILPWLSLLRPLPVAIVGLILLTCWFYPTSAQARYAAAEPVVGCRALATLGQPRRVFTTYNTGGHLLWTAPRTCSVFLDSRADVYGDAIIATGRRIQRGQG